jgi:hypothetical protein
MTLRATALAAVAAAAFGLSGCASAPPSHDLMGFTAEETSRADQRTTVRVTNNNWSSMTVYLLRNGLPVRLGTVQSMATAELTIPPDLVDTAARTQLAARAAVRQGEFVSAPVLLAAGQSVTFVIENNLRLSTAIVR